MARGLSKAQLRILQYIAAHQGDRIYRFDESFHWVAAYETGPRLDRRSVNRLIESGYIEQISMDTLSLSHYYNITEAGRQVLAGKSDHELADKENQGQAN